MVAESMVYLPAWFNSKIHMIATIPYIESKFDEFNSLIFDGRLPRLPIRLSKARTFLGACTFKKRRTMFGKIVCYDFVLRISTCFDLTERELEDIIIHEMIHYHICINRLEDTSVHGRLFRQMMGDINKKYGRNISISHRSTAVRQDGAASGRICWHVVAVLSFHDGRTGIKVLPHISRGILKYCKGVSGVREVRSVDLYMSDDVFFSRFPRSSALRVHYLDAADITGHLADAKKIECRGEEIMWKMR